MTIDEVISEFGRAELLEALGFTSPRDFLEEVTVSDAIDHFGESTVALNMDINEYWDIDSAYQRYGSDLIELFEEYRNINDWCASDYIDDYGDSEYMLEVLLTNYISLSNFITVMTNIYSKDDLVTLQEKLGVTPKVKHQVLETLLKANYEAQRRLNENSIL